MDNHLDADYESRQGADIDDMAGFEWWDDDGTDDEEELDLPWPNQDEIDDYHRQPPDPVQTDEERAQIAEEYDRFGDELDLMF